MGIKDVKINFIVDVAAKLILERSISEVTIKDIANKAEVGEATVYRYFSKKENLLVKVAMKLLESVYGEFSVTSGKSGYKRLEAFYMNYYNIYANHPELYKFLSEFDKVMEESKLDIDLNAYETGLTQFKDVFYSAYEDGLKDGSVRKVNDVELFYYSSAHALIELCKKKSVERDILKQDKDISKTGEVKCLVDIILANLKL